MAASKKKKTAKKAAKSSGAKRATVKAKSAVLKAKAKSAKAPAGAKKKSSAKAAPKKTSAKAKPAVRAAKAVRTAKAAVGKLARTVSNKISDTIGQVIHPGASAVEKLLTPLDDRIVVAVDPVGEQTAGGLFIPGTVNERPTRGRVLAVGRGRRNKKGQVRPVDVSVGEAVLFTASSGTKVTLSGTEVLILREDELLGVVG